MYPEYESDIRVCQRILEKGSKSFSQAARLLPRSMRQASSAVYAFCRVADDAIDTRETHTALKDLRNMLNRVYSDIQHDGAIERALCAVVKRYRIPRIVFDALLEGFSWDRENRQYAAIDDLEHYCARVASTVGVMMTLISGVRDPLVLARACEMGLAMQLTNIARDVGEDARQGRIYLPLEWLQVHGVSPESLLNKPVYSDELGLVVKKLLERAQRYYESGSLGLAYLPKESQPAMWAARFIYADIGRVIANQKYNSIDSRAYTSFPRKLWLLLRAIFAYSSQRKPLTITTTNSVQFLVHAVE